MSNAESNRFGGTCLPRRIKDKRGRIVQIRPYDPVDFDSLREMYDSFEPKGVECGLPPRDDKMRLDWVKHVVSQLFNVLAVYRRRIIGHGALDLSGTPLCPEYLIFVRKAFRDIGIGTAISEEMKAVAKEAKCEKVMLMVRTANSRAVRVFRKVGFEFCDGIDACRKMGLQQKTLQGRKQDRK